MAYLKVPRQLKGRMGTELGKALRAGALSALVAVWLLTGTTAAIANSPDLLFRLPESQAAPGEGAGELRNPRGVATDPGTGHVFVADLENERVSEYTAWGYFVKSWGWGVATGALELQTCGPSQPEGDPASSLCRAGSNGAGSGQMSLPLGLAVDAAGDVYVFELGNLRVQKFSPDGEFLLMFGGGVNKTKVDAGAPVEQQNVCPVDAGDVCQAGSSSEEPSHFSGSVGDYISYSSTENAILVGDKDGIQLFDLDGTYREEIAFDGPLAAFAGRSVTALDVDIAGNIYFALGGVEDVFKVSSAGLPLAPGKPGESSFEVAETGGVAVDVRGHLYIIAPQERIFSFDAAGNKTIPTQAEVDANDVFPYVPFLGPHITALATGICPGSDEPGNLYASFFSFAKASYVNAYGTPPSGCEPPPVRAPEVLEQFGTAVGREELTVKAQISPRFWADTTYFVEYGKGKCSEGDCGFKAPVSPALLTNKSINAPVPTAGVVLDGLEPGTLYRYRFVAQSSGGGPVFGIDPDGRDGAGLPSFEEGLEGVLKTFAAESPDPPCLSDPVRLGLSGLLPDCRAYEMVSPLDKGGGDVALWEGKNGVLPADFETHQVALSGKRFTYTSSLAFGDADSAPWISQHFAERGTTGWASEPISPPHTESPVPADFNFDDEYQGFTDDLCRAWVRPYSIAPLTDDAIEKYPNIYRRENCTEPPNYTAVTIKKPENRSPAQQADLAVRGFSTDGSHVVFGTSAKLHPDAPLLKPDEPMLYEHTPEGELRYVCYLPSGESNPIACSAGTMVDRVPVDLSSSHNAVSEDGSRIFWTAYSGTVQGQARPGHIYARIDGKETREVSTLVTLEPAFFWTAAADGSRAVFEVVAGPLKDNLYEVDVDSGTPVLIAQGVEGPMGASEDASRVYFASSEDLDGGGPATAGNHNLYLYEAGSGGGGGGFSFILEVPAADIGHPSVVSSPTSKPVDFSPAMRSARVSPDGLHVAFMSLVSPTPTGYDNRDADSGEPLAEVYLYDAEEDALRCISCHPSGARPTGDAGMASHIQGWEERNHAPRVLSEDGTRVFFESFEALVPDDANGTWDVYQWEELGKGSCTGTSDSYSDTTGGCVDLISAGTGPAKSTFLDADPSGNNIFFSTQESLVGSDYGLNDVYVARVGGGFPETAPPPPCEGAACQAPPPPPPEVTPPTETSAGAGNVTVKPKPRRCPKGKRKVRRAGKVKCVKRKAAHRRRAGR